MVTICLWWTRVTAEAAVDGSEDEDDKLPAGRYNSDIKDLSLLVPWISPSKNR